MTIAGIIASQHTGEPGVVVPDHVTLTTILDFKNGVYTRDGATIDVATAIERPDLIVGGTGLVIPENELNGAAEIIGALRADFVTMDWSLILHVRALEYPSLTPFLLRIQPTPAVGVVGLFLSTSSATIDENSDNDGIVNRGGFDWATAYPDGRVRMVSEDGDNLNYIGITEMPSKMSIAVNGEIYFAANFDSNVAVVVDRVFLGGEIDSGDQQNYSYSSVIFERLELRFRIVSEVDLLAETVLPP